ncbi:vascular endothelial growth factor Ab isoform X2 [Gadus chalcogrammus]|uniref:vascular endothelial growth factor Ab isoform X2 n=1 Tax=Gadus chalcogrammus TaxID=1042646 RepID=UPI0024C47C0C|nr:vascular endothelial growth factor Ab isoform X2 [Gadus chalcogrammus]
MDGFNPSSCLQEFPGRGGNHTWERWPICEPIQQTLFPDHTKLPSDRSRQLRTESAHIPREEGRGTTDVVPFMEVYNKSQCQPREVLVEVLHEYPEEVENIYIPSCVVLRRCAGCCSDEKMQCTPTSSHNITMEIKRIKLHRQQNNSFKSFAEHIACECRLLKTEVIEQENVCEPCSERRRKLFVQDPRTCQCSCKHTNEHCKERQLELNERTCKCDAPRR